MGQLSYLKRGGQLLEGGQGRGYRVRAFSLEFAKPASRELPKERCFEGGGRRDGWSKKEGSPGAPFSSIEFQAAFQAWSGKNFARVSCGGFGVTRETTTIAIRVLNTIATTGITS
mgnify:CR=1 FL=1